MNKSIKRSINNLSYQTIYQIITLITPFITLPIISRNLGPSGVGVFSYYSSTTIYFTMFAMLGIINYGTRTIAENQESKEWVSSVFVNVYSIQLISSTISLIIFFCYVFISNPQERIYFLSQVPSIISTFFDVSWLFLGLEDFKFIVKKNIYIKLLTVSSIVFFINKSPNPLITYLLIMSLSQLISSLILIPNISKCVVYFKPSMCEIKKHISPIIVLFLPVLFDNIFHLMDKTMLGKISDYSQLGYYYNSDRLVNIPLGIINGFGVVMLPRFSSMLSKNDKGFARVFDLTFELYIFVSIGLSMGVLGCSREFIPIFFGKEYEYCNRLMLIFIPIFVVKSISSFIKTNYLIPTKKEMYYINSSFAAIMVNLFLNLILIKKYGAFGAAISTLVSEIVVLIIQFLPIFKEFNISKWFKIFICYLCVGTVSYMLMRMFSVFFVSNIIKMIVEAAVGSISYIVMFLTMLFIRKIQVGK